MASRSCPAVFHARSFPQGIALSWAGRSISWEALNNYVHSTSRYLKEISVRSGAHILVVREGSPAFVIVLLALWRIGAVVCPVDPGVLSDKAGVVHAAVKPELIISARLFRRVWGQKVRWADIEHVVAYGYNDSFLGSEASVDPGIDMDQLAVLRLRLSDDAISVDNLTHQQLQEDPQDLQSLLEALETGKTYSI